MLEQIDKKKTIPNKAQEFAFTIMQRLDVVFVAPTAIYVFNLFYHTLLTYQGQRLRAK